MAKIRSQASRSVSPAGQVMPGKGMLMDRGPQGARRPLFGRPDPFCWIPVVSLVAIAALMVTSGAALVGVGFVVVALLLLAFDSWVNRPDAGPPPAPARPANPPEN